MMILPDHNRSVYVPWNVQRLRDTKSITIRLANRSSNAEAATWKLSVTQVECDNNNNAGGWGLGIFRRNSQLRAPVGCLQYFTEPSGTFESFNLNNRVGPYLGSLAYGICFARRPHDGQLRWVYLMSVPSKDISDICESDAIDCKRNSSRWAKRCRTVSVTIPTARPRWSRPNHGRISCPCAKRRSRRTMWTCWRIGSAAPESRRNNSLPVSLSLCLCVGHLLASKLLFQYFLTWFAARAPGPFMIQFSTDQQSSSDEKGFRFKYSITEWVQLDEQKGESTNISWKEKLWPHVCTHVCWDRVGKNQTGVLDMHNEF